MLQILPPFPEGSTGVTIMLEHCHTFSSITSDPIWCISFCWCSLLLASRLTSLERKLPHGAGLVRLTHTIQNMTWSRLNPCVLLYVGKLLGFGGREWYCTDFLFCHNYSKSSETTFVFGFEIVKSTNGFDKPFYTQYLLYVHRRGQLKDWSKRTSTH